MSSQPPTTAKPMDQEDEEHLKDFLEAMEKYSPTIPEEVVSYYLRKSGFNTDDPRILRMIALATHKFVADVVHDAMLFGKLKSVSGRKADRSGKKTLTMEDLSASLRDKGISVIKPEYYADSANSGAT